MTYPSTPEEAMRTYNTAYRFAVGVALAAAFILVWLNLAVGVIGYDGRNRLLTPRQSAGSAHPQNGGVRV